MIVLTIWRFGWVVTYWQYQPLANGVNDHPLKVLTHFFSDNLAYIDSTEIGFGIPPRRFVSFRQAVKEAGTSRFYGEIHFMDSVQEGLRQGKKVGSFVTSALSESAEPKTMASLTPPSR